MRVHLVNPSRVAFGVAVITPRWLYVLAAATGTEWGDPRIVDETLGHIDIESVAAGDVVGIGIHTGNARRGYELGHALRDRGAWVVYGGIHATLFPDEALEHGRAHAVVKGDGDLVWSRVVRDCVAGAPEKVYDGGRISGDAFVPARWDLLPADSYMWASVQTVRGCPKHCSFCSVWRTDGQAPRVRLVDAVVHEIVELRRKGFRFIALADDNFYPVSQADLAAADRREDKSRLHELQAMRQERFDLMERLAKLPSDTVFFTQITMEAAEDPEFLDAMRRARIRGALVGVESVTAAGLKDIYKGFNLSGDALVTRLREFRKHGVHVLGSFIFGLPSDREDTFKATLELAKASDITFAQFVLLTPFPGTVDFEKWAKSEGRESQLVEGIPITKHWLIPEHKRPKIFSPHPALTAEEIRTQTQGVWDQFYSWSNIWQRSAVVETVRSRIAFVLVSKLYRQMYANTGIATDSARINRSARWARFFGRLARRLFLAPPMPDLAVPQSTSPDLRLSGQGCTILGPMPADLRPEDSGKLARKMLRLHADFRRRHGLAPLPIVWTIAEDLDAAIGRATLNEPVALASPRPVVGGAISGFRRVFWRILKPIFDRQTDVNRSLIRVIDALLREREEHRYIHHDLSRRVAQLERQAQQAERDE